MRRRTSQLSVAVPGLVPGIDPVSHLDVRLKAGHGEFGGMYKSDRQR